MTAAQTLHPFAGRLAQRPGVRTVHIADRGRLFEDDIDPSDPCPFKNIRVT